MRGTLLDVYLAWNEGSTEGVETMNEHQQETLNKVFDLILVAAKDGKEMVQIGRPLTEIQHHLQELATALESTNTAIRDSIAAETVLSTITQQTSLVPKKTPRRRDT